MADINPILQAASQASRQTSQASASLATINDQEQQVYSQQAGLQLDIGTQKNIIDQAQQTGQLAVQNDMSKFALALGGDLGDTTGTMRKLADTFNQAEADKETALQEVNAKKSLSPFNDLFGWISAQFTINDDINKYNAAARTADQAKEHIDGINELVSRRGVADKELQTSVTTASLAASAQATSDAAAFAANQIKIQGYISNATNIEKQTSLSEQQLRIQGQVLNAEQGQQQIQLAQAHLKIAQDEATERLKLKSQTDQAYQDMADDIQRGYKVMYPNNPNMQKVAASPVTLTMLRNGKLDDRTQEAYRLGVLNRTAAPDSSTRLLASSPSQALQVLSYAPDISPAQRPVVAILQQAKSNLESNKATGNWASQYQAAVAAKDPQLAAQIYDKYATELLNQSSARVDGAGSLFYLPSIDQLVKQTPAASNLPVYKNVLAPTVAAGVDLSDPSKVFDITVDAVKKGQISANEAAKNLADIYKQGQVVNTQARGMVSFGLAPHISYNVPVNVNPLGGSNIVDMADSQSVLNAMSKLMAMEARAAAGTMFPRTNR